VGGQRGALRTGGEMHRADSFLVHLKVLAVHFGAQVRELQRDTAGGRFTNRRRAFRRELGAAATEVRFCRTI